MSLNFLKVIYRNNGNFEFNFFLSWKWEEEEKVAGFLWGYSSYGLVLVYIVLRMEKAEQRRIGIYT